jgi:hypothetical protein
LKIKMPPKPLNGEFGSAEKVPFRGLGAKKIKNEE